MQRGARRKRFLGGFILTGSRGRIPGIEEKIARSIVGYTEHVTPFLAFLHFSGFKSVLP